MKKFSILLGLLAGIAFALQTPSNGAAVAVAMPMVGADCIFCTDILCEGRQHRAWEPTVWPNYSRNDGPHVSKPCFPGTCASEHSPYCGLPDGGGKFAMVDMERLRGSIEAKDAQSVKDLLANHTESTALNVERSAVQVMDCEGAVIAHFPVGQKLLDRVSAE